MTGKGGRSGSRGTKGKKKASTKSKASGSKSAKSTKAEAPRERPTSGEGLITVLRDNGTASHDPGLSEETLLYLYRTMVQVREFDRRMLVLQRQGRIGFYGPILGQEAATVGSVAAVDEGDWIFPALREGAAAMMRGLPMKLAVAQLIGNDIDLCKGRQMPCHYTWRKGNYIAMSSVIGTQISHAVGAAMAAKTRGDKTVILGYMGDGATSATDFHSGMNFAGVTKAPCVLICQNNQWAISVPVSSQHASETIAQKGEAYGIPSVRVDGNDVLAVYEVTKRAADRARAGEGPTFIEAVTYRRLGHSSSDDPTRYRDPAEVEAWERKDPVERFRRYLEKQDLWDEAKEAALHKEIGAEVNQAIKEAEEAGPPESDSVITDVYAEVPQTLRDQYEDSRSS